jgi:hypothetical protein
MNVRLSVIIVTLVVILTAAGNCIAGEEQVITNQEQPSQTSVSSSESSIPAKAIAIEIYVGQLNLKMYEAAEAELSLCKDDATCLYHAKQMKSWRCAASVCDGEEKGKAPALCFEGYSDKYSKEVLPQINDSICAVIKSSGKETREALSSLVSDVFENSLVEEGAYLLALKGGADSCQNFIKSYVGAYGPNWNFKWYRAMSGCRILAHESTRDKEEKYFSVWFGVEQGLNNCSDIVNTELKAACNTPEAASPRPSYETLPGSVSSESELNKSLIHSLQLKMYKAILGDLSLCEEDEDCLSHAKEMKSWVCASGACAETDGKGEKPLDCFQDVANELSAEKKDQIGVPLCAMLKSPSPETRKALLVYLPNEEDDLIEPAAYRLALNVSAESCQALIKDYFGAYGSKWNLWRYRVLSGCRILAKESTVEQEEKDFNTWLAVGEGLSNCSSIVNSELKNACNTPGVTFPKPVDAKK